MEAAAFIGLHRQHQRDPGSSGDVQSTKNPMDATKLSFAKAEDAFAIAPFSLKIKTIGEAVDKPFMWRSFPRRTPEIDACLHRSSPLSISDV
ncbi:MAG: hypothetical protein V4523_01960 [Pseudomonadota bacterium]